MKKQITFFALLMGMIAAKAQTANFTVSVNGNKVTTINTSALTFNATDSFAAEWFFIGPGTMVYEKFDSALYEFTTGGQYEIVLNINHFVKTPASPTNWVLKQDTIEAIKTVMVGGSTFFSLSGNIKYQGQNTKQALPFLLKKVNDRYEMVRFTLLDDSGSFTFDNLVNDTFIIWAFPFTCDSCTLNSLNVLPTYSGDVAIIDNAIKIIPSANITNYNINLVEPTPLLGVISINGKVMNGNAPAASSILLTSTDKTKFYRSVASNVTDGNYNINNIEAGTYLLQPIVDGIPYAATTITVSQNGVFNINLAPATTSIFEKDMDLTTFSVYPNPFVDRIFIESIGNVKSRSVQLLNAQGKLFYENRNTTETEMNLSELQGGLYFIRIEAENGSVNTLRIIKN